MSEPTCEHASLMRYTCAVCAERDLAAVRARLAELEGTIERHHRKFDLIQKEQTRFRDPERTIVCDIIANGSLLPVPSRYEIRDEKAEIDRLRAENERLTERANWDHSSCNAWRAGAEKQIARLTSENERLREVNESVLVCQKHTHAVCGDEIGKTLINRCLVCEDDWLLGRCQDLIRRYADTRDARRVERALRHKDTNGVYPSDDPSNPWVHMVGRTLGILLDEWERMTGQRDIEEEGAYEKL